MTYRYIDKLSPNIRAMLLPNNAPLILLLRFSQLNDADQPQAAALEQHRQKLVSPQLVQDTVTPQKYNHYHGQYALTARSCASCSWRSSMMCHCANFNRLFFNRRFFNQTHERSDPAQLPTGGAA
ncbi:MAG: hypothetical protein R3F53_22635 [Gammaproteobacteria bacterium]